MGKLYHFQFCSSVLLRFRAYKPFVFEGDCFSVGIVLGHPRGSYLRKKRESQEKWVKICVN